MSAHSPCRRERGGRDGGANVALTSPAPVRGDGSFRLVERQGDTILRLRGRFTRRWLARLVVGIACAPAAGWVQPSSSCVTSAMSRSETARITRPRRSPEAGKGGSSFTAGDLACSVWSGRTGVCTRPAGASRLASRTGTGRAAASVPARRALRRICPGELCGRLRPLRQRQGPPRWRDRTTPLLSARGDRPRAEPDGGVCVHRGSRSGPPEVRAVSGPLASHARLGRGHRPDLAQARGQHA